MKHLLMFILIICACSKSQTSRDIVQAKVLFQGNPVVDQVVNFTSIRGGGSDAFAYTNSEGIANLDLRNGIYEEPNDYVFFAGDKEKCGYTHFINREVLHIMNLYNEEKLEVEIIEPDLENNIYKVGQKIEITLKCISNQAPINFRLPSIDPFSRKPNVIDFRKDQNNFPILRFNNEGIIRFWYNIQEGENGFWLQFINKGSDRQYTFEFPIKT